MPFCQNCGSELNATDTFCRSCGEQVKPSKSTSSGSQTHQSYQAPSAQSPTSYPPPKQLYRTPDNKVIAGVCGGLGEYLNIDPTLVRIGFVLFALFGPGLVVYLILALVVQEKPPRT